MQKKPIALAAILLALQGWANAVDVSIEERIHVLLINAANTTANPNATPQQKKEAAAATNFGAMAKEINAMQASVEEKNRLCQSKGMALSSLLGYEFGYFSGKCNDVFK